MNVLRVRWLAIFFCSLLLFVLYLLADRMLIHRSKFFNTRYIDKAFVTRMGKLIQDGVFVIDGDDIKIVESKLNEKVEKSQRGRVRSNLPNLFEKNGLIYFDSQRVAIANNRVSVDEQIERGRFLDRNGVVLANSSIDERTWKQRRHYNYGPQFFHIIGHWHKVFGNRNLESILDDYLSGKRHRPIFRKTSDPLHNLRVGDDVKLTVDTAVQKRAYELLRDKRGAVVVLDINSGAIIAAVSTPSFDPNSKERNVWQDSFSDNDNKPCENRAFSGLYQPGSTFKAIGATAWLEKGANGSGFKVYCNGAANKYDISDIHPHGAADFDKAFAESCNVFFSEAGVMLGPELLHYARLFGFNEGWNLLRQMPDHHFPVVASKAFVWDKTATEFDTRDFKRNPKLIAQGAIGQNIIMATPLQMALVAATVANKGVLREPYLVNEIRSGDGQIEFSSVPATGRKVMEERTAARLSGMMEKVMQQGTGKMVGKIYLDGGKYVVSQLIGGTPVRTAGKTGTAEIGDRNGNGEIDPDEIPHSWFIGFAPADNPRFAVAVIAENQGFGNLVAAPVAVEVLAEALNQREVAVRR